MKHIAIFLVCLLLAGCSIGTAIADRAELSGHVLLDSTNGNAVGYFEADDGRTYWIDAYMRGRLDGLEYCTLLASIGNDTVSGSDGVLYDIEVLYP